MFAFLVDSAAARNYLFVLMEILFDLCLAEIILTNTIFSLHLKSGASRVCVCVFVMCLSTRHIGKFNQNQQTRDNNNTQLNANDFFHVVFLGIGGNKHTIFLLLFFDCSINYY